MRYLHSSLILIAFCVFSAYGQTPETSSEVATKVDAIYQAMVDKDKSILENLTSDKLNYGHSSGTIEDKVQFIDAVINGSFDYISITPEEQKIIISGDVALVRHIFVTHALNDGKPTNVRIGNLMTFQKQNGDWKLLGRQAYKL
ncbi:nuclear transport factor 2 family protein [Ulvibacterium marinum]|uniref:Nuclear transport factor 2 family protein n=1 Tax=Ulvibacterium marinum TaxID=2419782 RepID=A0A3B0C2H3_9FLAO|nr:nuclear transport factor 2 family protein [Ulvibacterium marinum]RKN77927.1 nuclear transport factor 2 family protein [Ulvibacterium marinum]